MADLTPMRILFIDDEQLILNALRRTLRREGFELFFTTQPEDAVRLIGEHHIDLVVSDHMMPEMSGVELLGLVRRLHGHTVRIMMTGQADRAATIRALNEGSIYKFVEKPWDDAELKGILRECERTWRRKREAEQELATAGAVRPHLHKTIHRDATGAILINPREVG